MSDASQSDTREFSQQELQPAPTLTLQIGNRSKDCSYEQAFAIGYALVKVKNFRTAAEIFKRLAKETDRGPRGHIMLAICRAGLSDYVGARAVLDEVFADELAMLAVAIHEVIVDVRMGFKKDALRELVVLVNEHKELPTLCLWLGDLLEANQQLAKAIQCWKLAIKRDRVEGAVAQVAQQQLLRIQSTHGPSAGAS